tara:strand:- start:1784 stop:2662 length:879 start_codon:yes stop_codon:yes gene_type:complete
MKNKIFFCICTKNRKLKLFKNLISLRNLKDYLKYDIEIILVSNDKSNYVDFLKRFKNKLKIDFYKETFSGVVFPRNKILKILRKKNFDYAAFIDDDCIVDRDWLNSMINVLKKNKVDIVTGPQLSKSNNLFLKAIERDFKNGSKIKWASTNNVFFKSSVIRNNLTFSNKLNETGGEDQLFFLSLFKIGKTFYWNSHAPVYEFRDQKRENLRWFIKRNLRYGTSAVIIYKSLYGNIVGYFVLFIKLINDLKRLAVCMIKSLFFSKKNFYLFIMYKMRVIGLLIGLLGFQIKEY